MTYTNFRSSDKKPSEAPKSTVATMNDLIWGVGAAPLSRILPTDLKMLICTYARGYVVECLGAKEAEFKKNGQKNKREPGGECEEERFYLTPPPKGNWTCEQCLKFMRKWNPEVWKQRSGLEFVYKRERKPKRSYINTRWFAKKKTVEVENMEPESSCDSDVGEKVREIVDVRKKWNRKSRGQSSRKVIPRPSKRLYQTQHIQKNRVEECSHLPKSIAGGVANICCVCLETRRVRLL